MAHRGYEYEDTTVAYFSSSEDDEKHITPKRLPITDFQEWQDYMMEDLCNLWSGMQDHLNTFSVPLLENASFHDFCRFCFKFSSGFPPRYNFKEN